MEDSRKAYIDQDMHHGGSSFLEQEELEEILSDVKEKEEKVNEKKARKIKECFESLIHYSEAKSLSFFVNEYKALKEFWAIVE